MDGRSDQAPQERLRIAVAIATTGRADVVDRTAPLWAQQTRAYDHLIISAAGEGDVGPIARALGAQVTLGPKGLCAQRNTALDALAGAYDVVVFADDDYLPSRRFLAMTESILKGAPDIVALTGHVLKDGINSPGLSFEEALRIVQEDDALPEPEDFAMVPARHAYGCNMVIRVSAAPHLRFDERLPLYGWMEDLDFSRRMGAHGRLVRARALHGVHMGVKSGRQSQVRLGYSQVANLAYLAHKGVMPWSEARAQIARNVVANLVRALRPEPWVDRAGRLRGNLIAFADGLRGVQKPERVLDL